MNIWVELSTVAVEVFLPWYFFSGMFGKSNNSGITKAITGIVYTTVLAALSLLVPASIQRFLTIICLTYLAVKIYFDTSWISTVYPTILFFLFAILSDILCGLLLQFGGISADALMGDGVGRLIYNILGKLLHLLCLYITLTLTRARFDVQSLFRAIPLLSCQILSIYICYKNFTIVLAGNGPDFLRIETICLLYIDLIMCVFVEVLNRSHEKERESEIARKQLELQSKYYVDIVERQEETRSLWHDIKKYIASMEALVDNANKEEAQQCLDSIQTAFSKIANIVDTGNKLVDSILTYGVKKAEEVGVSIKPEIWVDSEIGFPATDLFVIIGNTLDNAIEACSQIDNEKERIVSVCLHQKNHLLLYEISNPYNEKSSKKAGKIHGYGLKNVSACVEKNNGIISIEKSNSIFRVSIQLNLND